MASRGRRTRSRKGAGRDVARSSRRWPDGCGTSTRRGTTGCPTTGPAILCPNHISFLDSAFLMLTRAAQHQLRRQGRVHGLVEDEVRLPGDGHDPDRPLRRREVAGRARRRGRRAATAASCSASSPRARAAATACCTRGAPAPPGWPSTSAARSSRSASSAPTTSSRRVPRRRSRSSSCSITIGRPVRPERYRDRREPHLAWRSMIDEVMFEIREMTGQAVPQPLRRRAPPRRRPSVPVVAHPASVTDPVEERRGARARRRCAA